MPKWVVVLAFLVLAAPASAQAAVVITFYSHTLGTYGDHIAFPHAFVTLRGTTSAGDPVKANFGFSAPDISPAMLWGPVDGALDVEPDDYVAEGHPHFSFTIDDDQYRAVLQVVKQWQDAPQPSYDLHTHNCVIFVKDIAAAVGLSVGDNADYILKPSEFLDDVAARNAVFFKNAKESGTALAASDTSHSR
jgi:hypothetical protein